MKFCPIDFEGELNPEQYLAVSAPAGPALVLAGAGSGKTRTLTYRVAWLRHHGLRPHQLLLLTFTNKAAREMMRRVEELTGEHFPPHWGGTFHSVGGRFLRSHGTSVGLQSSYTILDQDDSEKLLDQVMKETDPAFVKNKNNPKKAVVQNLISFARNTLRPLDEVVYERLPWADEVMTGAIVRFADQYRQSKINRQVADYDDLLEYWLRVLQQEPEVLARYQRQFEYILVDEYQDTNSLQAAIIDLLGSRHQIMAVGDDAQCIYTWRGANFANIANFPERHPGTIVYKIETNYRSSPQILNLANEVLSAQPAGQGYHKELRPVRPDRETPNLISLIDGHQQAAFILNRVQGLIEEGYRLSDMAVLYRAHYQALDLQLELTRHGVPFIITSGMKFFEQAHVRDLVAHLRFLHNPRDLPAFERLAMLLPKIGEKSAHKIYLAIEETAKREEISAAAAMSHAKVLSKVPEPAREDWNQLAATLQQIDEGLHPPVPAKTEPVEDLFGTAQPTENPPPKQPLTPAEAVNRAIDGWYGTYIKNVYPNWETRLDDLSSLIGFAERFTDMNELLAQLVLLNSETTDRGLEMQEDCLRLTTIHQAKGLEYPVVFVIGLTEGHFPLNRAIESDSVEEERRLFYVAVTRAKDELNLCYPMVFNQNGPVSNPGPSRFLQELSPERYRLIRYRSQKSNYY